MSTASHPLGMTHDTGSREMRRARFFTNAGRAALGLAVLVLLAAWAAAWNHGSFAGFSEQHLFSDATVLALLGIGFLLDAILHRQGA